jgi:hypothetical protein
VQLGDLLAYFVRVDEIEVTVELTRGRGGERVLECGVEFVGTLGVLLELELK